MTLTINQNAEELLRGAKKLLGPSSSSPARDATPIWIINIRRLRKITMDSVCELLHRVPQPVQWGLAGVGALAIGVKLLSYLQLLANVFILSGTNVCFPKVLLPLSNL